VTRVRTFLAAIRLGYAVATAPTAGAALCRLVGLEPSSTTKIKVEADVTTSDRILRYEAQGFSL